MNSMWISLSNTLAPRNPLKVILQRIIAELRAGDGHALHDQGFVDGPHIQGGIVKTQAVFILKVIIASVELPFQNQRGPGNIRHLELNIFPVFLFQGRHAVFFQQNAVVDDADIVRYQRDFGEDRPPD